MTHVKEHTTPSSAEPPPKSPFEKPRLFLHNILSNDLLLEHLIQLDPREIKGIRSYVMHNFDEQEKLATCHMLFTSIYSPDAFWTKKRRIGANSMVQVIGNMIEPQHIAQNMERATTQVEKLEKPTADMVSSFLTMRSVIRSILKEEQIDIPPEKIDFYFTILYEGHATYAEMMRVLGGVSARSIQRRAKRLADEGKLTLRYRRSRVTQPHASSIVRLSEAS